ncbi:hypothetical protein VKT23_015089 [Stygiomarasmius scandens]|uniref:Cytochrome P450 n=1 Tax=Marasmiellus scandens TaxID=2682957 RepID=A0ABR1J1E3_9AGAR
MCIPNVWCMNHDPEVYGPDADNFRPDRHLDEHGDLKDENSEGHHTYGFGLRNCVGRHVANNSLFIQIATILWTMSLEPGKDSNGNIVKPSANAENENGIATRPPLSKISVTPRFPDAEIIIQQTKDEIMEEVSANKSGEPR